MKPLFVPILCVAVIGLVGAAATKMVTDGTKSTKPGARIGTDPGGVKSGSELKPAAGHRLAAFSGGCFWGTEDEFRHVAGVVATAVGYTGGTVANPTYEQVCTHTTGHAETVLVEYDPNRVSYDALLEAFWKMHDPTTKDRQGPDVGDSYRSAIWTFSDEQMKAAVASRSRRQKKEKATIVTEIRPAKPFYIAEDYHQQYDEKAGRRFCPLPRGG